MNKFCIVAQGGGMISAYHAGVVAALKEKYGFQKLSRVVATSGAAAVYSYLVSGQEGLIQPIWEDLVKSGKFVRSWQFPPAKGVMNIDFLVDQMIKQKYPLNFEAIKTSGIKMDVGVTDAETGEVRFFSQDHDVDFFELLRATCAVPYFARGKVLLNGRGYYDGTISSVSGLESVINEDYILVVLIRDRPHRLPMWIRRVASWLFMRKESPGLQKAIWDMIESSPQIPLVIEQLRKKKNIEVIQPTKKLSMHRVDKSLNRLRHTIQQGYEDTLNHEGLDKFFEKMSKVN